MQYKTEIIISMKNNHAPQTKEELLAELKAELEKLK